MEVPSLRSAGEWFQITYTSADSVNGSRGGWGVKQTTPGAPSDVVETLRQWATTRLVEVVETSQFASDDALRERPRRLLSRDVDGTSCLWHAATAGLDATGRPGNVFTHAAALKTSLPLLRPIEYWRSPSWLSPFGVSDVNSARLVDLVPGSAVTRESVAAFIRAEDRLFSLEWVMAAVAYVVDRKSTLVLATGSTDEAALWLGAISYLTSAPQARQLGWVTYQRAADLDSIAGQDLRIACIPREDLETALEGADPDCLVLDPSWSLDDPGDQGDWRHDDQSFPVARWWQNSVLDAFALADEALMRVLERMDELALGMPTGEMLEMPLHWALSTSLLGDSQAVVSSREELLAECLRLMNRTTLSLPAVKPIVEEALSQISSAKDRASFAEDEIWGPMLQERAQVESIESYLSGGWRRGEAAPRPAVDSSLVRRASEGRVPELLRLATLDAAGTPEQLLAASRAVSTVVHHVVQGNADPDVAQAVATLKAQLARHHFAQDDLWPLHPDLLPESGPVSAPPVRLASAASRMGAVPSRGTSAPTLPPNVMPEPKRPLVAPPAQPVAEAGVAWRTPPEDLIDTLVQLREAAGEDAARGYALDDSLLVTLGLRAVPLLGLTEHLEEDRKRADALLRPEARVGSDDTGRGVTRAVIGWLASYWTLVLILDHPAGPPPLALRGIIKEHSRAATSAIARLLLELPDAEVARALCWALSRDIDGRGGSVFTIDPAEGPWLGLRACQDALGRMPLERRESIWSLATPDLEKLRQDFSDELEPRLQSFKENTQSVSDDPNRRTLRRGGS